MNFGRWVEVFGFDGFRFSSRVFVCSFVLVFVVSGF